MRPHIAAVLCVLASFANIGAQTQAGGAKAGVGKVYDGAGRSAAVRTLQSKMNGGLLKAAVARSTAAKAKPPAARPTSPRAAPIPQPEASLTDFTAKPDTGFDERFASALSTDPNEKEMLKLLVSSTRDAFEKEVAKQGRPNNLAAALTFFVVCTATVYHGDPEPSDAAVDKLWDGMNGTLNDMPELARLSDTEKQEMYNTLVAFGGLVLAGQMVSKQSGDKATGRLYKELSGALIQTVLKTDPATLRFTSAGLNIAN